MLLWSFLMRGLSVAFFLAVVSILALATIDGFGGPLGPSTRLGQGQEPEGSGNRSLPSNNDAQRFIQAGVGLAGEVTHIDCSSATLQQGLATNSSILVIVSNETGVPISGSLVRFLVVSEDERQLYSSFAMTGPDGSLQISARTRPCRMRLDLIPWSAELRLCEHSCSHGSGWIEIGVSQEDSVPLTVAVRAKRAQLECLVRSAEGTSIAGATVEFRSAIAWHTCAISEMDGEVCLWRDCESIESEGSRFQVSHQRYERAEIPVDEIGVRPGYIELKKRRGIVGRIAAPEAVSLDRIRIGLEESILPDFDSGENIVLAEVAMDGTFFVPVGQRRIAQLVAYLDLQEVSRTDVLEVDEAGGAIADVGIWSVGK